MARIAIGGFMHETNTFAPVRAEWADFVRAESFPGLTEGPAILETFPSMNIGIGGFIRQALALGHELVPIAWCAATPSSYVSEDAFERMSALLLAGFEKTETYDAIYLDLHGAMVSDHFEDAEGALLQRVRDTAGEDVPIVVSLDLHSNTTDLMLQAADCLIAYRTYPHLDMAETGERSARYLDNILKLSEKPFKARRTVPFLTPLTGQCTMLEPTASVYRELAALEEADPAMLCLSFTPGFPPADIWDCGPVVTAYAETQESADKAADALHAFITAREPQFKVPFLSPDNAVRKAIQSNAHKPFVLADVQDNCGAGATSDTTGLLDALVRGGAERAAIGVLVDPDAAAAAHAAGVGAELDMAIGGKLFTEGDPPYRGRFTVKALSDGRFTCTGPFYKGVSPDLGPCAHLQIGGVSVLVSTRRIQAADQEIFRHIGIEPTACKILGLKSSVHFRGDFTDIAEEILVVEAPGAFIDSPQKLPYKNLRPGVRLCPEGPAYQADRVN